MDVDDPAEVEREALADLAGSSASGQVRAWAQQLLRTGAAT
jgi:hypothetical protein